MASLTNISDSYGADSAKSIVCYFLANAGTWRGEVAKRVKAELKKMAGLNNLQKQGMLSCFFKSSIYLLIWNNIKH